MRKRLRKKRDKQALLNSINWWRDDCVDKWIDGIKAIKAMYSYDKPIRIVS